MHIEFFTIHIFFIILTILKYHRTFYKWFWCFYYCILLFYVTMKSLIDDVLFTVVWRVIFRCWFIKIWRVLLHIFIITLGWFKALCSSYFLKCKIWHSFLYFLQNKIIIIKLSFIKYPYLSQIKLKCRLFL